MHDDQDSLQIGDFAALVRLSIPQLRRYDRMQLEPEGRSIGMPGTGIGRGSERGEPRVLVKNLDGGAADCFDVCRPEPTVARFSDPEQHTPTRWHECRHTVDNDATGRHR